MNSNKPVFAKFSYSYLYSRLSDYLSRNDEAMLVETFFTFGSFMAITGMAFMLSTLQLTSENLLNGIYLLITATIVYLYSIALVSAAFRGLRNPLKKIPILALEMVCSITSPLTGKEGLSKIDLDYLKEIASLDQSSSDWRGNILTVIVIGTIGALLAGGKESVNWFFNSVFHNLEIGYINQNAQNIEVLLKFIFWEAFASLVFVFVKYLTDYLENYLSGEPTNRSILMACEEASSLLSSENNQVLNFPEKKQLAERFGYMVVPASDARDYTISKAIWIKSESNEDWVVLVDYKNVKPYIDIKPLFNLVKIIIRFVKRVLIGIAIVFLKTIGKIKKIIFRFSWPYRKK